MSESESDETKTPSKSTKYRRKRRATNAIFLRATSSGSDDTSDKGTPKRGCDAERLRVAGEPGPSCSVPTDVDSGSSGADRSSDSDHQAEFTWQDVDLARANHLEDGSNAEDLNLEAPTSSSEDVSYVESIDTSDNELIEEGVVNSSEMSDDNEPRNINAPQDDNVGDIPLYEGAPLTLIQSILAIMTLCLTHKLTGQCVADILALIALHCPPQNACVQSLYKFKKYFANVGRRILIFHYFCSSCFDLLPSKDDICNRCGEGHEKCFFIEIPLLTQLQTMFKRPGFIQDLQFRFSRNKLIENNIEDIYDGKIYKEQFDGGFLKNPNHISLMWYTDGVSIFNSTKFSIWPLYFMINELNYKNRIKQQNIILAGLWFGDVKPQVNTYFQPFHTALEHFRKVGYMLEIPNGPPIRVRGLLLCGTCDLPAKSMILRFKQFNGIYGCAFCKSPGQRYQETNVHVYPYLPVVNVRTNEEVDEFARQAVQSDAAVYGVKGPSILYKMVPNMVFSTAIDVMHGVFLGISKFLTLLWFDSAYSNMPFSLSQVLDVVDEKLMNISPPSYVPRMPRKIKETLAFWKALEFKLWLLYYSIPVLTGIMDEEYFHHHIKLVSAISLLSQISISPQHHESATHLLNEYVRDFEHLYGLRYMSMNVHQLVHLPDVVLNLGPLWVYSCFIWEDLNGKLTKLFHGSRQVGVQICSSASVLLNLAGMISQLDPQSAAYRYCERLSKVGPDYKIVEVISDKLYAVGTLMEIDRLANDVRNLFNRDHRILGGHYQIFDRLRKSGVLYSCTGYIRSNKRTSTYVAFSLHGEPKLGNLKLFVRWSGCECTKKCLCLPAQYFCIIDVYERVPWVAHEIPHVRLLHMNKVHRSNETVAIPVSSLECLCHHIIVDDCEYILKPVNTLETE